MKKLNIERPDRRSQRYIGRSTSHTNLSHALSPLATLVQHMGVSTDRRGVRRTDDGRFDVDGWQGYRRPADTSISTAQPYSFTLWISRYSEANDSEREVTGEPLRRSQRHPLLSSPITSILSLCLALRHRTIG